MALESTDFQVLSIIGTPLVYILSGLKKIIWGPNSEAKKIENNLFPVTLPTLIFWGLLKLFWRLLGY